MKLPHEWYEPMARSLKFHFGKRSQDKEAEDRPDVEVKLGLEGRSILVLGGLKPPGHGDAGRRSRAGGLSEARSVWHVCPCVRRSEAKQCDSAPAAWFVYLSSCAHTVPQAQPAAPFLPCVQSSLLRESLTAGIRSIPGVCCPAAELALPGGGSVGGSPHLTSTSALPAPTPPLGHSDDVRSGSAGLTSLPPPQPR